MIPLSNNFLIVCGYNDVILLATLICIYFSDISNINNLYVYYLLHYLNEYYYILIS